MRPSSSTPGRSWPTPPPGPGRQAAERFALAEEGYIYSRISNPTCDVFASRVNAMEGGVGAAAFASGAAAIAGGVLGLCGAGDHIVAATNIYGGT